MATEKHSRRKNIYMNILSTVSDTYVLLECCTVICYGNEVCMRCNKLQCIRT